MYFLTDGAEVSRGISALVPKCPDTSAPVKIWCRIVSRHFGTILYWCRTVLVPKCLGAEVSGKRFYTPLEISAAKKLLVSQHNDNIDKCSLKAERRIKFYTRTVHEAKLV